MGLKEILYIVGCDEDKCKIFCMPFPSGDKQYFDDIILIGKDKMVLIDAQGNEKRITKSCVMPKLTEERFEEWANELCKKLMKCKAIVEISDPRDDDPTEETKQLQGITTGCHVDDLKTLVTLFIFSNPNCITLDFEGTQLIDTNDYIMGDKTFGRRPIKPLKTFEGDKAGLSVRTVGTGADVDPTVTQAELIAAHIAQLEAKETLADGATIGVLCVTVKQIPDKRNIFDDLAAADAPVTSEESIVVTNTLPGGTDVDNLVVGDTALEYGLNPVDDGTCTGKINPDCELKADHVLINAPVGTAYETCYTFGCFGAPAK